MELTQRLGCTQTLNESRTENFCPEQVAFLGICGQKYPVVRGPNKIGRDPDTCNIVLKLNSISRHHAVINVLNSSEYMIMDLNSANKTKLENKVLDPYIPYPLKNGDMVQLGQVFGIFRLLHDDNDLPMTQAVEIPETPIAARHISKFNNVHITTVPESPDVSDKDDSFIMPSQPKMKEIMKNHINTNKPFVKPLLVPELGTKKIDNAYWNSSRKSDSINTSITSLNSSNTSSTILETKVTANNIHELNTQIPNEVENNENVDSLFTAETQLRENRPSLNIYNMETQIPVNDNLPAVCKIQDHQNVAIDFFTDNKENDNIFEAETQKCHISNPQFPTVKIDDKEDSKLQKMGTNTSHDTSDDIIAFVEMDSPPLVEIFESQALLPAEEDVVDNENLLLRKNESKTEKRSVRLKSDSSTDCEDGDDDLIRLSQNVLEKRTEVDDDLTDCEDIPECQERVQKPNADDDLTDCEDDLFIKNNEICDKVKIDKVEQINFEDLPTQIVVEDQTNGISKNDIQHEDMLTQIVEVPVPQSNFENEVNIEDMLTQVVVENENKQTNKSIKNPTNLSITPFKVPQSPLKSKKDSKNIVQQVPIISKSKAEDDYHYASTQEVFDDLCSQRETNSVPLTFPVNSKMSIEEKNNVLLDNKLSIDVNEKTKECSSINTVQSVNLVLDIAKPSKIASDSSSDVENTPKKLRPLTFMETDLPDSQEIKSSVTFNNRRNIIDVSSESDTENDSEQCTPILFHHKKNKTNDAKMNLTKKFDVDALPTRVITRVRKPTSKALNNADISNKITKNILKPKFLTEQEENIDKEIITENISRLKSKASKPQTKEKTSRKEKTNTDKKSKKEIEEKTDNKTKENNAEKNSRSCKETPEIPMKHSTSTTSLDKSVSLSRTTRSRTRKKAVTDKKSTSPEVVKTKRKKSDQDNKTENCNHISDYTVRRSRRQKNKEDDRHRNSKENEKSTVYNVSSETSLDTSANKRSGEFKFPSAKKAKTSHGGDTSASKYTVDTQYVLFTAFPNEEVKNKLQSLGAVIVNDVMSCTMVLTLQIKRTFKLLCAVGLGRPIVGPTWVQACADANCIVDPNQYVIKDEATEQRFQFDLQKTLRGRRNFLKGYKVSCTPKVMPNAKEMKLIVECSGGTWKEGGKNWLCVSCTADRPLWPQYKRRGAAVVSTELILAGVLRQQLDIDGNRLA